MRCASSSSSRNTSTTWPKSIWLQPVSRAVGGRRHRAGTRAGTGDDLPTRGVSQPVGRADHRGQRRSDRVGVDQVAAAPAAPHASATAAVSVGCCSPQPAKLESVPRRGRNRTAAMESAGQRAARRGRHAGAAAAGGHRRRLRHARGLGGSDRQQPATPAPASSGWRRRCRAPPPDSYGARNWVGFDPIDDLPAADGVLRKRLPVDDPTCSPGSQRAPTNSMTRLLRHRRSDERGRGGAFRPRVGPLPCARGQDERRCQAGRPSTARCSTCVGVRDPRRLDRSGPAVGAAAHAGPRVDALPGRAGRQRSGRRAGSQRGQPAGHEHALAVHRHHRRR